MKGLHVLCVLLSGLSFASTSYSGDQYDYIDTPVGIQVDDLLDDDRDGVINARDACPDTAVGSEIDNDGCSLRLISTEELQLRILFSHNSADISPVFQSQITQMADFLGAYPATKIQLQGHASKLGKQEYNIQLSQQRATAVRELLLQTGVSADRVTIVGYGDQSLENAGDSAINHAVNRRVVATVVGHKGSIPQRWTIFSSKPK